MPTPNPHANPLPPQFLPEPWAGITAHSSPVEIRVPGATAPPSELGSLSVSVCLSIMASLAPCARLLCLPFGFLGLLHLCSHTSGFSQPPAPPSTPHKSSRSVPAAKQHLLSGSLDFISQHSYLTGPTQHSVLGPAPAPSHWADGTCSSQCPPF